MNVMGLKEERCHRSEVASAPANCPEKILVFLFAGGDEPPICQDNIRSKKIVDRQTARASEMAQPAAQSQSANSG